MGECRIAAPKQRGNVLLVVTGIADPAPAQIQALQEAVASYSAVNVRLVLDSEYNDRLLQGVRAVIVLANAPIANPNGLALLLNDTKALGLPVIWMGLEAYLFAGALGLRPVDGMSTPTLAPSSAQIEYKGARLAVSGHLLGRPVEPRPSPAIHVVATIRLPGGATRPIIVSGENLVYMGFLPFNGLDPSPMLALAIDAMAEKLGVHPRDPRVILRLEDISGREDEANGEGFAEATSYLLEQGVFIHLAASPEWVDEEGKLVADIGAAQSVLDLLREHPYEAEVVQHGFRHYRKDRRNAGKPSCMAHEFFFDDDETMGADAARALAELRLESGLAVMQRYMPRPRMFEAPHYEMSQAEEMAARELFPVILHPLQHHGGMQSAFLFPWLTWRGGIAYGQSDVGYLVPDDPARITSILGKLKTLADVLADPVVVVFYHSYITEHPGNERDLEDLVEGIRNLGYRFTSVCEELATAR